MKRLINSPVIISALSLFGAANLSAATLITIDVSDPANVVFTATGAAPTRDQTTPLFFGLSFMGFLTGNAADTGSMAGNLKSATSDAFDEFSLSNATSSLPSAGVDLALSKFVVGDMVFVTSSPAFSGSSSMDLSGFSGLLPAAGTAGDIRPGLNDTITASIGTYQVVPEPSSLLLLMLATGASLAIRRRAA